MSAGTLIGTARLAHLWGQAASLLPPGDAGTGYPCCPAVQPHRAALIHLGPLGAHLDPGSTAPCRQNPCEDASLSLSQPHPHLEACPLTVDLKHGPGHMLPSTAVGTAQVLALIRGIDGWKAQDAAVVVDLSLCRKLATRTPWSGDMGQHTLGLALVLLTQDSQSHLSIPEWGWGSPWRYSGTQPVVLAAQ